MFEYWTNFCRTRKVSCGQDILNSCLWYNSHISKDLFYSNWYQKGIFTVGDIVDFDGNILAINVLKDRYNLNINFLNYYTVKSKVLGFLNKYRNCVSSGKLRQISLIRPYLPFHANIIFRISKSNHFYKNLMQIKDHKEITNHELKWNSQLSDLIYNENWNIYYKACFKAIKDNSLVWFQYRVLFRILGTRSYLYKIKITDSNLCGLCGSHSETITHLFVECPKVKDLWTNISKWFENKLSIKIELDTPSKILGCRMSTFGH